MQDIVPGNESFFMPRGNPGCILMHGFTAMPEEMKLLGEFLASIGCTVYGVRFAGHATHPADLKRTRWTDWLEDVADGLAILSTLCTKRVLIGQSMGGAVALTAAAQHPVDAVVALSTPFAFHEEVHLVNRIRMRLHPTIEKQVERFPRDHPLYRRRELNYPAYPEFPLRILRELQGLLSAMQAALPLVKAPTLLVHSRQDQSVPFSCQQEIYNRLGCAQKQMLAFDGMDHSLVLDPQRQQVFDAISKFLSVLA